MLFKAVKIEAKTPFKALIVTGKRFQVPKQYLPLLSQSLQLVKLLTLSIGKFQEVKKVTFKCNYSNVKDSELQIKISLPSNCPSKNPATMTYPCKTGKEE